MSLIDNSPDLESKAMNDIQLYGWNRELFQQKQKSNYKNFMHGRVTVTHRTCYEVISETGCYLCELTGNMLYGRDDAEYPCTGDWVIFQPTDADKGIIFDKLPRSKTLYRLKSGSVTKKQAIASHIDKALIVQSLDSGFNVRRIERFILQLSGENIQPVLILTKTDLGFNADETDKSIAHLSHKMPVFYTSIKSPESIDKLRKFIQIGETVVFTGMSGVGKSTLINALCGQEVLQTGVISDSTGKGKHTSTRREMVLLPGSGVLIDTPGVKLFGITNDNTDNLSEILDISGYERRCRFRNCQHVDEKGCAVIEAVEKGEIDNGLYESYLKLRREAWHYSASVHEKRKKEKSLSKLIDEVKLRKANR